MVENWKKLELQTDVPSDKQYDAVAWDSQFWKNSRAIINNIQKENKPENNVNSPSNNEQKNAPGSTMERKLDLASQIDLFTKELPVEYIRHEGTNDAWVSLDRHWKMTAEKGIIKTTSVLFAGDEPIKGEDTIYELYQVAGGDYKLHTKGKNDNGEVEEETLTLTENEVREDVLTAFKGRLDLIKEWEREDNRKNEEEQQRQREERTRRNSRFATNDLNQNQGPMFS